MGKMQLTAACGIVLGLFLMQACATQMGGGSGSGKASHAHMGHVTDGWKDTPNGMGLGPTMEEEAKIAEKHAGFAAKKPDNLKWMQTHTRHVRHAIDTSTESSGPGMGYGVIKAARGVAAHIGFAAKSGDASKNVKAHAVHVKTSAENVAALGKRIIALSKSVLKAASASDARPAVEMIEELTQRMLQGYDANLDGTISWKKGEGGIAQAKKHIGFMKKGEGL